MRATEDAVLPPVRLRSISRAVLRPCSFSLKTRELLGQLLVFFSFGSLLAQPVLLFLRQLRQSAALS